MLAVGIPDETISKPIRKVGPVQSELSNVRSKRKQDRNKSDRPLLTRGLNSVGKLS